MSVNPFKSISTAIILTLAALGCTAGITFLITEHEIFPYKIVKSIENKVIKLVRQDESRSNSTSANTTTEDLSSIFLRLQLESFTAEMPNNVNVGGGMTSYRNEILFINQIGNIYLVEDKKITPTNIQPPNNGLESYASLDADPSYKDYNIDPNSIRYNDIHYYEYEEKSGLVISYTEWLHDKKCYGSTVAKLTIPNGANSILEIKAKSEQWEIVFRSQPCLPLKTMVTAIEGHMAGGRIAYSPPSTIYLASGEYHWDGLYAPEILAQSWENDYGKVLAIDLTTKKTEKISIGHRNMQGILYDTDEQLWVIEHGARGGDELNKIKSGANYGWPVQTLGTRYNYLPWPNIVNFGRHDLPKFESPFYSFVPSIGISGFTQIKNFHSAWDGDFLVGSLSKKSLFRLRIRPDRLLFAERIPIGKRIRYVLQHTDGRIVLWTDEMKFIFITQAKADNSYSFIEKLLKKKIQSEKLRKDVRTAVLGCMECHAFNTKDAGAGPPLGAVFGKDIASTSYENYSEDLKAVSGKWNEDSLFSYLQAPQEFAPGTSMPNPNIKSPEITSELIKIMRQLATDLEVGG